MRKRGKEKKKNECNLCLVVEKVKEKPKKIKDIGSRCSNLINEKMFKLNSMLMETLSFRYWDA